MNVHSNWKDWMKAAAVRAAKTVAQTAAASVGTAALLGEVDWPMVVSAALLAGVLSLLTSLAGLPEVAQDPAAQSLELPLVREGAGEDRDSIGEGFENLMRYSVRGETGFAREEDHGEDE